MRFFEGFEDFFGDGGFGDDALDGAGAVAEDGEEELAGGAEVVEPAAEGDGLAFVLAEREAMVAMGAVSVLVGSDILRIYLVLDYRIVWVGRLREDARDGLALLTVARHLVLVGTSTPADPSTALKDDNFSMRTGVVRWSV